MTLAIPVPIETSKEYCATRIDLGDLGPESLFLANLAGDVSILNRAQG